MEKYANVDALNNKKMAFRKNLSTLFTSRIGSLRDCRVTSSSSASSVFVRTLRHCDSTTNERASDRRDNVFSSRRFLHKNVAVLPELRNLPVGEKLMEKLKGMDTLKNRITFDGLNTPVRKSEAKATVVVEAAELVEGYSVQDARKLLKLAQIETVKSRLRKIEKCWILKSELVQICTEVCSDADQGKRFAQLLDESGTVIVLGDIVFLRPEQVANAIGGLIPTPTSKIDQKISEFEQMEKQKAIIDTRASSLVRRELWCGLGFMVVQTAGFMRLTFWDLTWDVMEPICFYVTSMYFMAGYTFFLRTSKEPSFEGFFQSRFAAKQMRIMKSENFDMKRYDELRKALNIGSSSSSSTTLFRDAERV